MKKSMFILIAALVLAFGLALPAGAAQTSEIQVQLDGEPLTFTDAVPQVKEQRTFLPFRAVFEAMGAQVSNKGNVITAVREGKTLTMTIGSTEATVTEDGKVSVLTMDVAPYVDNATWRTYVPVRFAAQAFDCNVGWDQEAMTAIIVDTDKLFAAVKEGKSFTLMEKYLDYSQKYNTGIWDMQMSFDGGMTVMGLPITVKGSAGGTVADSAKMSMDMKMTMDMTDLIAGLQQLMEGTGEAVSAEDQAMLDALAEEGIGLRMRGDLEAGKLYMNMSGSILQEAGISSEAWYLMDMAALYEGMGMDYADLIAVSRTLDYGALVKSALSGVELTDSTMAYSQLKTVAEQMAYAFSDNGFQQRGDDFVAVIDYDEDGARLYMTLGLTVKNDQVVAYSMDLGLNSVQEETAMTMEMKLAVDEQDRMSAGVSMNVADMVTMELTMSGGYVKGTKAPETEPPAGATVIPFENMAEL